MLFQFHKVMELVFSFVGFESLELKINGRNTIDVTLETDMSDVEEVVVIGYGE